MTSASDFIADLQWRGLVFQSTNEPAMIEQLDKGRVTLYAGFDPTAESLHVGNLVPLLTLARFQREGHRALALVGGSTGLIGDPSGKHAERDFQAPEVVAARTKLLATQLGHFVDFTNSASGACVNNLDWTQGVGVLEFLRDIGKHFSVNAMMSRDSVKSRIDREGSGISFTEFSYMLLQSFDFLKLAENENCTLQIGGSDQWGNMCSGVDLIRRKLGKEAFAMTLPLLTTHDGKKFGKSEKGAIWLSAELTSPWDFLQFWLNTDDKDVVRFLKMFTFVGREEIESLDDATKTEPHLRAAQKRLAQELTDLVHGSETRGELEAAALALFGKGNLDSLSVSMLSSIGKSLGNVTVDPSEKAPSIARLLVLTGLESSMTRATQVVTQGGVSVNQIKVSDPAAVISEDTLLHGRFAVLKKGKRDVAIIDVTPAALK